MTTRALFRLLLAGTAMTAATLPTFAQAQDTRSVDPHANETAAQRDKRMKWWREARFGMFIHWGLYASPAGIWNGRPVNGLGEWIMNDAHIPVADYAAIAPKFNPTQFDAEKWVAMAKAAGMKYIVITAKHHDGFAMYPSKVSTYNIVDGTPFKRDPLAELGAACKKAGIKFGLYYSQAQDWHHAGGGAFQKHWDPAAQDGDFHAYIQKIAAPQVREIFAKYKPAVLWWDTPLPMTPEDVRDLTSGFAGLPGLIANNRLGNGVPGDTETPEQYVPATGFPGRDWETCMTMNDTWGYKTRDQNFKSTTTLARHLIDIASKGGNFLLNIGPDARGVVPDAEVQRLAEIGAWMKSNGDGIYGTSPSPYRRLPFNGRVTVKGNNLYLHVFSWPSELKLGGLQTAVKSAKVLATGKPLTVSTGNDGTITIGKPESTDPIATTIVLKLAAKPVVVEPELLVSADASTGAFQLTPFDATLEGKTIQAQGGDEMNIGYWTDANDAVSWKLNVAKPASYAVSLTYSCENGTGGSKFVVQVDGKDTEVTGVVAETGSWEDFRTVKLDGALVLAPGTHVVRLKPLSKPGFAVMNLKSIALTSR